ncbi:hypothetical protein [Streptomyces sp. NPDC058623]
MAVVVDLGDRGPAQSALQPISDWKLPPAVTILLLRSSVIQWVTP